MTAGIAVRGKMVRLGVVLLTLLLLALAVPARAAARTSAYTADFSTLLVVDTANPSIAARLPVGGRITGSVVMDAQGTRVFVPLDGGVAVVDAASRTVVRTIPLPGAVSGLTSSIDGSRVYAGATTPGGAGGPSTGQGTVAVVETGTLRVAGQVPLGRAIGSIALNPLGHRVYVAHEDSAGFGAIGVLEPISGSPVGSISLTVGMPSAMVVHPSGARLYAAVRDQVFVVDTASQTVQAVVSIPATNPADSRQATALRLDPSGSLLHVFSREVRSASPSQGFVTVIDSADYRVISEFGLPLSPAAAAFDSEGTRLYVAGRFPETCSVPSQCPSTATAIAVLDAATLGVLSVVSTGGTTPGGSFPANVAIHPELKVVYASQGDGRLAVFDPQTRTLLASLPGDGIAFDPLSQEVPGSVQLAVAASSGVGTGDQAFGQLGDQLVPGDYDGDGRADLALWRPREGPEEGIWIIQRSSDGVVIRQQWGAAFLGDVPVPADYDGDGRVDIAVWRPGDGAWYVRRSSDGGVSSLNWGGAAAGDIPVPADYDGDGKADIAVWRPGSGGQSALWYIVGSRNGAGYAVPHGVATDVPVPADYDGDGRADVAIWRPSTGEWFVLLSSTGGVEYAPFGAPGDVPVPGDYDGSGRASLAVWRPSTGEWFVQNGGSMAWGAVLDRPTSRDFDGDGQVDPVLFRPPGQVSLQAITAPLPRPRTPTPTSVVLTLVTGGTREGTVSGGGTYAPGASVTVRAAASGTAIFAGWSGSSPCPQGSTNPATFVMPASALTCTASFGQAPLPPAPNSGSWTLLSAGSGPSGWYFSHAAVERNGAGRIWHTWAGGTYLFDPAANTWRQVAANDVGWRENFGSDHDTDNGVIWIGPQASRPGAFDAGAAFSLATNQYEAVAGACSADSILAWDQVRKRLYCYAGWTTRELLARSSAPGGTWAALKPSGPFPTMVQEGARMSMLRGGIDSRNGQLWVIGDNQELYRYSPDSNAWAVIPTSGPRPPETTVFALHEQANTIVGFVGCADLVDPCTLAVQQTYLLDLATNTWRAGPGPAQRVPTARPEVRYIPLYDRVRQRMLLMVGATSSEVWQWTPGSGSDGTTTPPPTTLPPPPPPPPPASSNPSPVPGPTTTGPCQPLARQFVECALPLLTTNAAPFEAQGNTKDVNWAFDSRRSQLIFGTGDFTATYAGDSGNQTIFSYTVGTNLWQTISPYCHPAGQITPNHPSDRGPMIYDSLRDALWLWNGVPFPDRENQICSNWAGTGSTLKSGLLRMDMTTGVWTQVTAAKTGSLGNGVYDTAADAMLHFERGEGCSGNPGRLIVTPLASLQQTAYDLCVRPAPAWTSANGGWVAPEQPERVFFAWDDARRIAYVVVPQRRYDPAGNVAESVASLSAFNRATNTWTALPPAPVAAGIPLIPYQTAAVWDSVNRKVIYPVVSDPCGIVRQMLVFDPALNSWEEIPLPATPIHGATVAFDPRANAVVLAGSVFCTNFSQQSLFLWRYGP